MNTIKSVGYGWGVLIVAGAGSYYFAKRSVNADREARAEAEEKRRQQRERLRVQEMASRYAAIGDDKGVQRKQSSKDSSLQNQSNTKSADDLAPTPAVAYKSQYEASEPFRSRKGDRFS